MDIFCFVFCLLNFSITNYFKRTIMNYNGWTNYATWRVYVEIFADFDFDDEWYGTNRDKDFCQDFAEESIFNDIPDGLAKDYAYAFLRDVNWCEIAQHLNEE